MTAEDKTDISELMAAIKQLNPTALILVQNSTDTLLMYQRMREENCAGKAEMAEMELVASMR